MVETKNGQGERTFEQLMSEQVRQRASEAIEAFFLDTKYRLKEALGKVTQYHEDSKTAENPQDVLYSLELCCDHLRQLSFRFDEAVQAASRYARAYNVTL